MGSLVCGRRWARVAVPLGCGLGCFSGPGLSSLEQAELFLQDCFSLGQGLLRGESVTLPHEITHTSRLDVKGKKKNPKRQT